MTPQQILDYKKKLAKLADKGNFEGAARLAKKVVDASPADIGAWWALAQMYERLGQIELAIRGYYQVCQGPSQLFEHAVARAVTLSVDYAEWNLGVAPAQEWVKLKPKDVEVWAALAKCWVGLKRYIEAVPVLEKVLELDSKHTYANQALANAYMNTLQQEKALVLLQGCIDAGHASVEQAMISAYSSNCSDQLSEQQVVARHQTYASLVKEKRKVVNNDSFPERRIKRLGFVSEDFVNHSVSYFFLPLIENFNFDDWEIYCYSCVRSPDEVTSKLMNHADHWVECRDLSHDALLDRVGSDELDVLVDLQGISGASRISIFLSRLALVQVSYLGYPNTTGFESIDFRLTDNQCDPEAAGVSLYSESLYRMDGSFLCYRPEDVTPEVSPLPALENGYVTFCSFNSIQKYSETTLSIWAEILNRVPESRLLIKCIALFDPLMRERVWALFSSKGIAKERIELKGWSSSKFDHLEIYGQADLHLDSFPYNGTTTTCESLWQGVPMVALDGDVHRSRVGASLMRSLDLGDWVASDREQYIDLAVQKASDLNSLAELRSSLRDVMSSSILMDESGFARRFELALSNMVEIKRGEIT